MVTDPVYCFSHREDTSHGYTRSAPERERRVLSYFIGRYSDRGAAGTYSILHEISFSNVSLLHVISCQFATRIYKRADVCSACTPPLPLHPPPTHRHARTNARTHPHPPTPTHPPTHTHTHTHTHETFGCFNIQVRVHRADSSDFHVISRV